MTNDEFLAWVEMTFDPDELIEKLIHYGIMDYEDILTELEPYISELQDSIFIDDGSVEWDD